MVEPTSSSSSASSKTAAEFRAKSQFMKSWRPESSPSNRDRLELYALYKQAVSGDAPPSDPPDATVADRAKFSTWRTKRGMSQNDAMTKYISECDRQIRVYGTRTLDDDHDNNNGDDNHPGGASSSTATSREGLKDGGNVRPTATPTNTPAGTGSLTLDDDSSSASVLLTPRGLAAVPLLCAAAAESRAAYLTRLANTIPENGWWKRQEPLCADPGSWLALPESIVLLVASKVEFLSLQVFSGGTPAAAATTASSSSSVSSTGRGGGGGGGGGGSIISPSVPRAFFWPLHNVLIAIWILLIFICTTFGSAVVAIQTVLVGSKRTEVPLNTLFTEEIIPMRNAAKSLCDPHQAITIRLIGLGLMPLCTICDISKTAIDVGGFLGGSVLYCIMVGLTWWYWICVLPWLGFGACWIALCGCSWCFALIELAGV